MQKWRQTKIWVQSKSFEKISQIIEIMLFWIILNFPKKKSGNEKGRRMEKDGLVEKLNQKEKKRNKKRKEKMNKIINSKLQGCWSILLVPFFLLFLKTIISFILFFNFIKILFKKKSKDNFKTVKNKTRPL